MTLLKFLRNVVSLFLLTTISPLIAMEKEEARENLLTRMCLLGFNQEMKLAGKKAPVEMANFTCSCFIKKVSFGLSLESAKEFCTKEAVHKFTLNNNT